MRRLWKQTIRKSRRLAQPIILGQIPLGFYLAAGILFFWQLSQPALAQVKTGSSQNQYFRVEWMYDLGQGTGLITFHSLYPNRFIDLRDVRIQTVGVPLTNLRASTLFGIPSFRSYQSGQPDAFGRFNYNYLTLSAVPLQMFTTPGWEVTSEISFEFPTQNVTTNNSLLYFCGSLSGMGQALSGNMDFVSVQAIPEIPGDLTSDGKVNLEDLARLGTAWGTTNPAADIAPAGGDGSVDQQDLLLLAENWLRGIAD